LIQRHFCFPFGNLLTIIRETEYLSILGFKVAGFACMRRFYYDEGGDVLCKLPLFMENEETA
jgi:hypothetical protein